MVVLNEAHGVHSILINSIPSGRVDRRIVLWPSMTRPEVAWNSVTHIPRKETPLEPACKCPVRESRVPSVTKTMWLINGLIMPPPSSFQRAIHSRTRAAIPPRIFNFAAARPATTSIGTPTRRINAGKTSRRATNRRSPPHAGQMGSAARSVQPHCRHCLTRPRIPRATITRRARPS